MRRSSRSGTMDGMWAGNARATRPTKSGAVTTGGAVVTTRSPRGTGMTRQQLEGAPLGVGQQQAAFGAPGRIEQKK